MFVKEGFEFYLTSTSIFSKNDKSPNERTIEEFYTCVEQADKLKVYQFMLTIKKTSQKFIKELGRILGKRTDDNQIASVSHCLGKYV